MKFFKTFLAALLAFFVGGFLLFYFSIMFFSGLVAAMGMSSATTVGAHTVLKIDLGDHYTDSPAPAKIDALDFQDVKIRKSNSLLNLIRAIDAAAIDDNIDGIYLCGAEMPSLEAEQGEELRAALMEFRQSGKFVVSYSDFYSQMGYYICSVADKVAVNPNGEVTWHGVSTQLLFFKGLLDKLDVKAEVIRHGNFKAAVEPFILEKMSPANSLQMNELVSTIWGSIVGDVAASRGLDSAQLQSYATDLVIVSPAVAREKGLVDTLLYQDQVYAMLKEYTEDYSETDALPRMVSLGAYSFGGQGGKTASVSKNKVAVLYASGDIVDGKGSQNQIGGARLASQIADLRRDNSVKAVVLRVNSPGGSALASEVISREMDLLREEKPVIVSLGGTAASGGYYIAAPADAILSGRTTITGSIGVFGLAFDLEKGLKNKLGITIDVARSNPSADLEMPIRALKPNEIAYMKYQVEEVYDTFVGRVAAGRNLAREDVEKIAEGRVWSGYSAMDIGLIDGFGGLKQAISLAADRADVADDFIIYEVTPTISSLSQIFSLLSDKETGTEYGGMGKVLTEYGRAASSLFRKGIQARMPYEIELQ